MSSVQLSLPAGWARAFTSHRDAYDQLDAIAHDKIEARAAIRAILEGLAAKHGVRPRDVNRAMTGYVADALDDVLYEVERNLQHEIEGLQSID